MNEDAIIGYIDWRACNLCRHYKRKAGGCDLADDYDGTHREGDYIFCNDFEKIGVHTEAKGAQE